MPRTRRKYVVRDASQVRAMSGPVQHQIVATLERLGPCSVKELADHLGMAPESLYYHFRRLRSVGLLVVREERATARRPEAIYELPGRELVFETRAAPARLRAALAGLQRSLMTMAVRLYARALAGTGAVGRGPARNLCIIQQNARLAPKHLKELNRRLEEVAEFVAEHDDPTQEPFVSLTISLSPVLRDSSPRPRD